MKHYVLVTAAYNEERYIEPLLQSVVAQTAPPLCWIVVSDGSTDRTDEIVLQYAAKAPFLRLYRVTEDHPRNFAAQVHAINTGLRQLRDLDYEFVGNLDADITLEPDYFEKLMEKFSADPGLGLAGGDVWERAANQEFAPRDIATTMAVPHACQFFRRQVFDEIGGAYVPLPYGGPDTYAEVAVRRLGWRVSTFRDIKVYHHRPTNGAEGVLKGCFRQGKMDYSLGMLPLFEVLRLLRRARARPLLRGALYRGAGFVQSWWKREARAVPPEFIEFLREEQRQRLRGMLRMRSSQTVKDRLSTPPPA